ncbi:helix-turn-helix domain-containing protein [Schnuerera sp. xch1]|uniref:winged helix-turn-helix domain-containing protein n=1 Tax=Schnuerera sp. xch1 TaxID=2874283 RepID=UPI001CBB4DF5|nr:helix-turn-helix domain-containing protein [Schnuerera sp. xch1]MBZ2175559.1 helix-turn-helix domain-containing protein [Schnuerera sp. xch1]
MNNNKIILKTEKELKIFMSPIRQKIIKQMEIEGKPITSKHIADKLNISPSSAQHHIKQLQEIGIIEFDHSEIINGIRAKYLKLTEKTVSIGGYIDDDLALDRDAIAKNMLFETYNNYQALITEKRPIIIEEYNKGNKVVDLLSGVVHLTTEDANELYDIINQFINNHSKASTDTHPFEFALIAFRSDLYR